MSPDPLKKFSEIARSTGGRGPSGSDYGRYAGLGIQFAAAIGLLTWLGWYADEKLGTSPLFLIVGLLLGFVGGTFSIIRAIPPVGGRKPTRDGGDDTDSISRD